MSRQPPHPTLRCADPWPVLVFSSLNWGTLVALVVKNSPASAGNTRDGIRSLGQEDTLEEEMASHFSILAWEIPWIEEPGGLQRVGHD